MNKGFALNNQNMSGPIFSDDSVERELELLKSEANLVKWQAPNGEMFTMTLPHTVYPPREDTFFLAKCLLKLGPGKGRRCLEIGTGSGVLSLMCHRQGWRVSACDINPMAIASAKNMLSNNQAADVIIREGGPGPSSDGDVQQWSGSEKYDLIFWNMPYVRINEFDSHLGPMEEAALTDTSSQGLVSLTLMQINTSKILKSSGIGLLTVGEHFDHDELLSMCAEHGFAGRVIDDLTFGDGERIKLLAFWQPYAMHPTVFRQTVTSTNTVLLSNEWPTGSSLSAEIQTQGRGRYDRAWQNTPQNLSCSWKISLPKGLSPGLIQVILGSLVYKSFDSAKFKQQEAEIILKWPNDLVVKVGEEWGKVCGVLVESVTLGGNTTTVVGIGINIANEMPQTNFGFKIGYADWYDKTLTRDYFMNQIHCRIAGLLEEKHNLPGSTLPYYLESVHSAISEAFMSCKSVLYKNRKVDFILLNEDGTLLLKDEEGTVLNIRDGEELIWAFS